MLAPLAKELRIPRAVATGLRANGIDPDEISPGQLVTGLLNLFGYRVNPTGISSWMATKAGETTYIAEEAYREGDHPELSEGAIRKFLIDFGSTGANRGMLVTDKYGPIEIYELERRNPKVRFVTRSRLQSDDRFAFPYLRKSNLAWNFSTVSGIKTLKTACGPRASGVKVTTKG